MEILSAFECKYPSDCIYFSRKNRDYFGVGLYFLEDELTQNRIGGISIYNKNKIINEFSKKFKTKLTYEASKPDLFINTESGVVNFEWDKFDDDFYTNNVNNHNCSSHNSDLITCLCSNKTIKYYYVDLESLNYTLLNSIRSKNVDDNNNIIGLDLSSVSHNGTKKTCYSISDGRVFIIKDMEFIDTEFIAHNKTEVWTVSFLDNTQGNILATGGDDCAISLWDLRTSNSIYDGVVKNLNAHSMGVTCIEKYDHSQNHLFWSGSYDETLSLWDIRNFSTPIEKVNVCGGVWRISNLNYANNHFVGLALCYFGFKYYNINSKNDFYYFKEAISLPNESENVDSIRHKSIVYGLDSLYNHNCQGPNSVLSATCSFYDNTVIISSVLLSD
ncbi:WD domain protein [Cryptosporidium ryanae]|uniref:WD domain protein n=1 Tax=Cryptosporidium ryanae TaxID=515981 RepID=UPI003519DA56|nr:WD domain protein [Cryptosporidium ryanae]